MIAPLHNIKLKGVLWYQGESNTAKPLRYSQLFTTLVNDWRHNFKQEDLPFLFTQLANLETNNNHNNWAILRDEQRRSLNVPHTAMAVTIDVGEYNDLHPQDKKASGNVLPYVLNIPLTVKRLFIVDLYTRK
ncbi:sialate O-acetylesterase [Bacillus sp. JCM 19034]|uniref:sialate O-acetylesterase n=1 Tax=Bacillus sp. JCM 19034 TaxID=1481928 RepID=UPI00078164CD|nr:sialate O-acetylesterase [Bacillus sp. JCM 19034]